MEIPFTIIKFRDAFLHYSFSALPTSLSAIPADREILFPPVTMNFDLRITLTPQSDPVSVKINQRAKYPDKRPLISKVILFDTHKHQTDCSTGLLKRLVKIMSVLKDNVLD